MIPPRLLTTTCSFMSRSTTKDTAFGQVNEKWTVVVAGVPCRIDENKTDRYVSQTADMEKSSHVLLLNHPLPAPITVVSVKDNHVIVDSLEYRVMMVNPVNGLLSVPSHYQINLMRVS